MKILFLSYHHYFSPNKAGFHHLARAMREMGHEVHFLTSGSDSTVFGFIRYLRRDRAKAWRALRIMRTAFFPRRIDGVLQTCWFSLAHTPNNFHRFWRFLSRVYLAGYSRPFLGGRYDAAVFESSQGLLLFERFHRRNPGARLVYRVSDDLPMMDNNPALIRAEARLVARFHLVSTPSTYITNRLRRLAPEAASRIMNHNHALHKAAFASRRPNPYAASPNVLFVGLGYFDHRFLELAHMARPDLQFHLIGNMEQRIQAPNIHYHGIMRFEDIVPYMQHADIGLQSLAHSKNVEVFERTLKYVQYTWCRLPVVAPHYLNLADNHVFKYDYTAESVRDALAAALAFDRSRIETGWVQDYWELAGKLLGTAGD